MDVFQQILNDHTAELVLVDEAAHHRQPISEVVVAVAERDVLRRWLDQTKCLPRECSQEACLPGTERTEKDHV